MNEALAGGSGLLASLGRGGAACMIAVPLTFWIPIAMPVVVLTCIALMAMDA